MVSSFFNLNNCSKNWRLCNALHCTYAYRMRLAASRIQIVPEWPPVACKLYPSGRQLHANYTRVAASCMQIIPEWPPVACKLYPRGRQSHATWIKSMGICLWLAATLVQFACDWWPLGYKLNAIGHQSHAILHASGGENNLFATGHHLSTVWLAASRMQTK